MHAVRRFTALGAVLATLISPPIASAAEPTTAVPPPAHETFAPPGELPVQDDLPDLFTCLDGSKVTTAEEWRAKRRPELIKLIQHYMYGAAPVGVQIESKVTQTVPDVLGGKATLKEVEIKFVGLPDDAPRLHLALFTPNKVTAKVPVFLGMNPCGNREVLTDERITIDPQAWVAERCVKPERGSKADFWCVETLIDRGYGFATFHESDVDPDRHDFKDGIHPFFPNLPEATESRWGTIAAWAWGYSKCVDYLVTDGKVDAHRIAVIGHSRRGKTALLAGALDERIALVVPHQSGTGGMAISRKSDQETVKRINDVFPHWFNDLFTQFNDQVERLPFDQHVVVAIVAPRPVLDTEGAQDAWANFPASLRTLQAADKVYKLLGFQGLADDGLAAPGQSPAGEKFGDLVQFRLDEKHTLTKAYWVGILDYADRYYKARGDVDPAQLKPYSK